MTGVSKFSKTSVFSGLNNLNDITLDTRVSTLLGYTDEEITSYFSAHIQNIAQEHTLSEELIHQEMKQWYNGYQFSEAPSGGATGATGLTGSGATGATGFTGLLARQVVQLEPLDRQALRVQRGPRVQQEQVVF